MLPVIAIVGRPNVGKSTLFNCLTKTRRALVADQPGLTRDRQYGEGQIDEQPYIIVDTGGLGGDIAAITTQVIKAIQESDAILFMVDCRGGLTVDDEIIAKKLRRFHKPIFLVVNKIDGIDIDAAIADFYQLGLGEPYPIAAAHGRGVTSLLDEVLAQIPVKEKPTIPLPRAGIKIAFIGRPNVGKSTLMNRILGEERVIVYDQPGTTRDSIFVPFSCRNKDYILIDTAGIRRRGKVTEKIEKFSVIKALQAIEEANVVVLVLDAKDGITDQDLRLLGFILDAGRALVIAVNKWDGLDKYECEQVQKELDRRLAFIDFVKIYFISALHGTGVGHLFPSINNAYQSANKKLPTSQLTRILEKAMEEYEPPLVRGKRVKLRYAHLGGSNPPIIVIHGKRAKTITKSYRRYLEKFFRKSLNLIGTPIKIEFRSEERSKA
jgi:GTP-binding protein